MVRLMTLAGVAVLVSLAGCAGKQAKQEAAQSGQAVTENKPAATQQQEQAAQTSNPAESQPQTQSSPPPPPPAKSPDQPTPTNDAQAKTTPSGLKYVDLKVGTGPSPLKGQRVTVHYTGWLATGKKFDSSLDRGQPYPFLIGTGVVIPGWDEGIMGMKVGGKRKLIIPPQLAYGARDMGNGLIPANSTLVFEVELLGVQ